MAETRKSERPDAGSADAPEVMTIGQAAKYLQLHPQVVYRHVRAGTLPASRIGRTIRFKRSVLDAFLEQSGWASVGEFLAFQKGRAGGEAGEPRRKRFSVEVD